MSRKSKFGLNIAEIIISKKEHKHHKEHKANNTPQQLQINCSLCEESYYENFMYIL